jgi:ATP-dependent exoDNAse (exonuclease V) beta subunit
LDIDYSLEFLQELLAQLADHYQLFGLQATIDQLFYRLHIANSNYAANVSSVDTVISEACGDISLAYKLIQDSFDETYSIEFQKGDGGQVVIMTAHASKGLEFDHVLMGGISTNGRYRGNSSYFGKTPGSLKWQYDSDERSMIDTPQFYLEKEIVRFKDFSESKRLFYVVGTRAIKTLSWVTIAMDSNKAKQKRLAIKNSWAYGLDCFLPQLDTRQDEIAMQLQDNLKQNHRAWQTTYPLEVSFESRSMIYHIDHLGIEKCMGNRDGESLLVLSELSVTALASLHLCPKRFYLNYILKLDPQVITSKAEDSIDDSYKQEVEEDRSYEDIAPLRSSAQRGTLIHQSIYDLTIGKPNDIGQLTNKDRAAIDWAVEQIRSRGTDFCLKAEIEVKFDFFGFKVSGIPDLVIIDEDSQVLEVWDYKTGERKQEKESVYIRQLQYYLYGLVNSTILYGGFELVGSLLYVDQQERVDFKFTKDLLQEELFQEFEQMNNLLIENRESCTFCKFKQLCRP